MTATTIQPHAYKGALFNAMAFFLLAFASAGIKLLNNAVPIVTIVFFINAVCLLMIAPLVLKQGLAQFKTQRIALHLARDMVGVFCWFFLFASFHTLPLADSILLFNAAPLWLPFIILFWLKVKIKAHLWPGLIIGFIGIICILKPGADVLHVGFLYALLSGVCLGFTLLAVRLLSSTEPPLRILFYFFLVSVIVTLPLVVVYWQPLTTRQIILLISSGIFVCISQYCLTFSFRYAKASTLAPITYTTVVYAAVLDWLIWNHVPHGLTILGMLLVISGGLLTLIQERKLEKQIS